MPKTDFLARGLQQLLAEREIRKPACAKLRKAAQQALDDLSKNPPPPSIAPADDYFYIFREACEQTRLSRLQSTALDAIQKLLAYGLLRGNAPLEGQPERFLIDQIVETICGCFVGENTPDNVSLQIVKALLTVGTSAHCEVHEGTVLRAVRTCFNIHLFSKSLVIQTTAKASLTQMLSVVFQRMEAAAASSAVVAVDSPLPSRPAPISVPDTPLSPKSLSIASDHGANLPSDNESSASEGKAPGEDTAQVDASTGETEAGPSGQDIDAVDANKEDEKSGEGEECKAKTDELDTRAEKADKDKGEACESTGETTQGTQQNGPRVEGIGETLGEQSARFMHVQQVDAYLVLRALCKLSNKEGGERAGPFGVRSKVLALELLLGILQHAGPCLQTHESYIAAIKQYLCPSLLNNGVSPVPQVFELTLAVYLCLLASFKTHLKVQLEVFFKDIFLPILETSASSFQLKWLVLQAISRICTDPQTLVDLYVNYDCDLTLSNVFETMISDVSKIAMGRGAVDLGAAAGQEGQVEAMRVVGLECLSWCLGAMVEWMTRRDREAYAPEPDALSEQPSFAADDDVLALKRKKEVVEEVVAAFNEKPKKGLAYAQKKGLVGPTPEHVAEWFRTEERLSKTAIGEYLGDPDPFALQVMYAYVDSMNFTSLDFVNALRVFLEGFRLPGEAQKIDRLMEKFAAKYCDSNPRYEVFENADTAYVLAYSIIMLTTDLHSAQVKKKMSPDEFIRNNRGINDGKDLPRDFLVGIYKDIQGKEIRVQGDRSGANKTHYSEAQLLNERTRTMLYHAEMESRLYTAQALLADKERTNVHFATATNVAYLKPMLASVWASMLAAFSVGFQSSSDPYVVRLCLEGYGHAIHVSAAFELDLQRDAFMQSLVQFTSLLSPSPHLDTKKMECVKTLLHIANAHSNYLGTSWYAVLKCISQLDFAINCSTPEELQLLAASSELPGLADHKPASPSHSQSFLPAGRASPYTAPRDPDTPAQTVMVACDRVFANTVNLSQESILEFVKCLCQVSTEELGTPGGARMYSMQKIVEISYYNMDRIRIEWSRIWTVLGEHFNRVGVHSNLSVAMFAVDSLRQLSMKFLERGELAHFHFQKDFLKPFEYIMNHSKRPDIRDLVVNCVAQMVQSQAPNIRSGWKNIFFVFSLTAADGPAPYVPLAFQTTMSVFANHFEVFQDTAFVDGVNCLVEFACNRAYGGLAMEAVGLLQQCVGTVAGQAQAQGDTADEDRVWVHGWFPLLFGLHRVMTRCQLDVRTRALTVLIDAIKQYGKAFKRENWQDLFRITFRIFDDLKLPEPAAERLEWLNTTCNHALFAVLEVFNMYFDELRDVVYSDLLDCIRWCAVQNNEVLGRSATQSIQVLLLTNGRRMTAPMWDAAVDTVCAVFADTTPRELFAHSPTDITSAASKGTPPFSFASVIIKCVVQLELIEAVENVLLQRTLSDRNISHGEIECEQDPKNGMYDELSTHQLLRLVDCIRDANLFARRFNSDLPLRTALWKAGFMRQLPNLLKQETTSVHASAVILYTIYNDAERLDHWPAVEDRLIQLSKSLLEQFNTLTTEKQRETWVPVMQLVLSSMNALDHDKFARHVGANYTLLSDMMALDIQANVRDVLRETFRRIGTEFVTPPVLQDTAA